ncbi:autotransporter outer membrane beta-barrel domain-containing protein [Burkholderia sp. L27(2015)]|uniref:autotransporter outer membrane beta-barrel domain-containing protein n=1 Tax=Burkholderia sp. L27(2015) TaxID=1641858 RepID=UPI00131CB7A7|nr:autotransporter outer membrane beta-barrel domain-containing protein [Burkholderia sp. L27(2015)]
MPTQPVSSQLDGSPNCWVCFGSDNNGAFPTRPVAAAVLMTIPLCTQQAWAQDVVSGQVAISAIVSNNMFQNVLSGGTAFFTSTFNLGRQQISLGGLASGTVIFSGGAQSNGGLAMATTVFLGGQQAILSGGVASTTVLNGGALVILAGGVASGTIVNSGGGIAVSSGATVIGTAVNSGVQIVVNGGSSISTTILRQGSELVRGVASATVLNGGSQFISSGGVARGTVADGIFSFQDVGPSGTAIGTLIANTGQQTVESGGLAISSTVSNGGVQSVAGLASATLVDSGGLQVVVNGTAVSTTVVNGGQQFVGFGGEIAIASATLVTGNAEQFVVFNGVAVSTTVGGGAAGSLQSVTPDGVAVSTTLLNNGLQDVEGGIASNTVISAGGIQVVRGIGGTAGIAVSTTIGALGEERISAGGSASDTVVGSGGLQTVSSGGLATSTTISGGGQQTVSAGGIANLTTVNSGGAEIVSTGAVANNTVVNSGGGLMVASGGTANRAVIGAQVDAVNGAIFSDTQIAAGGQLNTYTGSLIGGITTIAGTLAIQDTNEQFGTLTLAGGTLQFGMANTQPASFISATVNTLDGSGVVSMRTDVAAQTGDFLTVNNAQTGQQVDVHDYYDGRALDPTQRLRLISAAGPGVFTLVNGATDVGAYQYGLVNQGGDWFLFNLGTRTETADSAQAAAQAASLVWYGELQPLYRRLGELRLNPAGDGVWARTYGDSVHVTPTNAVGVNITQYGVEAGVDHRFATDLGAWYLGMVAGTGWVNQTFANNTGTGSATPWTIGTYATWLSNAGWYGDFVVKYNNIDQKISTTAADGQGVSASYRQNGYTLSAEGGRRFELAQRWFVEPQVELTTIHYGGASYTTSYDGTLVHVDSGNASLGRVTLRVGRQFETQWQASPLKLEPYGEVSFIRQFQGGSDVSVDGTTLNSTAPGDRGQLTLGVTAQSRNLQLYTAFSYARGQHYEQPWSFDIGLRKTW